MKKNQADYELNLFDRFLYKMIIGLSLLVLVLIGARYQIIQLEKIQQTLSQNINIVKIIERFNSPVLTLIPIDLDDAEEVASIDYSNYSIINGGRRINVDGEVKSIKNGVVVKITKYETYSVTVKGADGYEYTYDNLDKKNVNMYQYVKAGTVIGKVNHNNFDLYVYSRQGPINLDDVLPV